MIPQIKNIFGMRIFYLLGLMLVLLAIPVLSEGIEINLTTPTNGSIVTTGIGSFSFKINMTANVSLFINNTFNQSMNLTTNGTFTFPDILMPNADYFWNISGVNHSNSAISGNAVSFEFTMLTVTGALVIGECPTGSTAEILVLWLIVLISLFFIGLGITQNLGVLGFFGSIMFMVTSWFLAGCQPFFAYIVAVFSFVLIIWFVIRGLGFNNTTFK